MKHLEATEWCIDNDIIYQEANHVSWYVKKLLNIIQHIDTQLNEKDSIRVQGIISVDQFIEFIKIHEYTGTVKYRFPNNEVLLTFYLDRK